MSNKDRHGLHTDLAELPGAWKPRQLVLVRLTFALTKRSSETAQNFIFVKHDILSHIFFSSPSPRPHTPFFFHRHLQRNKMQMTSDNKFWPGHLLDKLYLYFPEKPHDRAHALFSCVRPTRSVYYGI